MAAYTSDDIQKFIDVLKAMNAIHPWIGTAVAIMGLVTGGITIYNTVKTLLNTKANNVTATCVAALEKKIAAHNIRMTEHETAMKTLEQTATQKIEAAANKVTDAIHMSQTMVAEETRKLKIATANLHRLNEQKLSNIPKIQDRLDYTEKKVNEILDVITKAKSKGGS